jgi:hypothetical protein
MARENRTAMSDSMADTRPTFSRLTEGKATQSWRAAVPIVIVVVAFAALLAYLASSLSSSSQKARSAERDANQYRDQVTAMSKQVSDLQNEVTLTRSPGRTTVVLESSEPAPAARKGKAKAAAAPASRAWAAVTWGELPNGKSWMRVNAYGLQQTLDQNKSYHVWMQPTSGDPVDVGSLEVDQNGGGFAMKSDLPAIDQGKAVMLTTDAANTKQPGDTIAKADLPKLQPTMKAQPQEQQGQARSGTESQQMHQGGK